MGHRRIFDDVARFDPEPSRGEDSFSFLNRVASPYWERVRAFIDSAFELYPVADAADLRARFRDRRWPIHIGAWWELYLFTMFRALGGRVEIHPELPDVTARPDFRIDVADSTFLVEARYLTAGLGSDERNGHDDWITGPLDALWHPNFMVGVRILVRGASQPRRAGVTAGVIKWLDSLDPDAVTALPVDRFPRYLGAAADWRFELRALPMKATARGNRRRRLVGMFPPTGGWDNTTMALRSALKEKAGKYGQTGSPFIIATLLTSGFVDTEDVFAALYGSEFVSLSLSDQVEPQLSRRADGFWRFGPGFRNTRVSGVLVANAVLPWTAAKALPRLWIHPEAAHPLPSDVGLPTATIGSDARLSLSQGDREEAELFGLNADWPGPEPPFP
jgi:hypothetical protein